MAGFSKMFVFGKGGYDGVNPIDFVVLVGEANRQWLEPRYFKNGIQPLGRLKTVVPAGPNAKDSLLDACIAFSPRLFKTCPALAEVEAELGAIERLDFDADQDRIPRSWAALREEARPLFEALDIWQADFVPLGTPA